MAAHHRHILRTALIVIVAITVILPLTIVGLLYIPPVLNAVKDLALPYVAEATGMDIKVDRLRLGFPLGIEAEGVTIVQASGDTMVVADGVGADVSVAQLLMGEIAVSGLRARGVRYQLNNADSLMWLTARVRSMALDYGTVSLSFEDIDVNRVSLSGARVNLIMQPDSVAVPADTTASQPLRILAREVVLDSIDYFMSMLPVIDTLGVHLDKAVLRQGYVDTYRRTVNAKKLEVTGVDGSYLTPSAEWLASHPQPPVAAPENTPDSAAWTITADTLHLAARNALYGVSGARPMPGLDMAHVEVADVDILVTDFYNRGADVTVPLKRLKARERCGIELTAGGTFAMVSGMMEARDFNIATGYSRFSANGRMALGDLAADPGLALELDARGSLSVNDVVLAMPAMKPLLAGFPRYRDIWLDASVSGTSSRLEVNRGDVRIPGCLTLSVGGTVDNPFKPDKIGGRLTISGSLSNPRPLGPILSKTGLSGGLRVAPFTVKGTVDYHPMLAKGDIKVTSGGGDVALAGSWNGRSEGYDVTLKARQFPLASFMPDAGVGTVTADVDVTGHGYNPFSATTEMNVDVDLKSVDYRGQDYCDASLRASLSGGSGYGTLVSHNPDADLNVDFDMSIDSGTVNGSLRGAIHELNLRVLGLMDVQCHGTASVDIAGRYTLSSGAFNAQGALTDLDWVYDSMEFVTQRIDIGAQSASAGVSLDVANGDLSLRAVSGEPLDSLGTSFAEVMDVISTQIKEMRIDVPRLQSALPPMEVALAMGSSNLVGPVLAEKGIELEHATLDMRNDSLMTLDAGASGLKIGNTRIDTLGLSAFQNGKYLVYQAMMNNRPGTFDKFAHVSLNGYLAEDRVSAFLSQSNIKGREGFKFGAMLTLTDSVLHTKLVPFNPTIAYREWQLNDDNFLDYVISTRRINGNIELRDGSSYLKIFTEPSADGGNDDLVVDISDIHIADWLSISPFAPPMAGDLNANVRVHFADGQLTGKGDVSLIDFKYGRERVGTFRVLADLATDPKTGFLRADADMWVNGRRSVTIGGLLNDSLSADPFKLDFSMIHFPLEVANPFLPAGTASLSGSLNGTMKITGETSRPVFTGYLEFDSAAVKLPLTGMSYIISDEKIRVDSNLVTLSNFSVNTLNRNPLFINGTADISDLSDVVLDITADGSDMLLVNSNRPRGADVYGKAFLDLEASVEGPVSNLVCRAGVTLLSGSNVTYVMPEATSALRSQSTSGMVRFVQFNDSLAVAGADSVAPSSSLTLAAELVVESNTTLSIDLSSDGKNKVSVQGAGELDYSMNPENDGRLTGRFNINGGFARYSPPLLGEKMFKFNEGSYIAFNGDMMNPAFEIRAYDPLKANVVQEGQNSRLVDFRVLLSATGTLNNMNVVFDLETDDLTISNQLAGMSAEQRANQAMNMLLYNKYTGDGTTANASLGGNPLYSFLESQLNSWASNYVKGVDLSFGIDQYDRTLDGNTSTAMSYSYRVSKSFMDDRIKIVVGGNYSTDANTDENFSENLINDISFEYLLNRKGTMIVRVFRHQDFESIVEGEVTQTGVGFVYRRKIHNLKQLFHWRHKKKK